MHREPGHSTSHSLASRPGVAGKPEDVRPEPLEERRKRLARPIEKQ